MTFSENVSGIVDDIELQRPYDKAIIKHRFLDEINYYEKKRDETKKYYNVFRFIVTTGSILLPAVLSMGQMDPAKLPKNFDMISYWCSWTISLLVTGSNGFLQLFSLDKNYFSYSMVVEQLKTEGWQFFQLSGKYEDCEDHKEAYKPFSKSIENIKRKQVEKEFSGKGDVNKNKGGKNKKPEFDFQKELLKQLPDKYEGKQMKEMDTKLNQLDTKNTEPLTSIAETTLKLRKDEIKSQNIREDILKNSPDKNEDFFVVPKVVE